MKKWVLMVTSTLKERKDYSMVNELGEQTGHLAKNSGLCEARGDNGQTVVRRHEMKCELGSISGEDEQWAK